MKTNLTKEQIEAAREWCGSQRKYYAQCVEEIPEHIDVAIKALDLAEASLPPTKGQDDE